MMSQRPVLILGGTAEARDLAAAAVERFGEAAVITSLAGRTADPLRPAGRLRVGGFGGATGLAAYIAEAGIGCVVDATHPFARRMAANAHAASGTAGCPHVRLERPPWQAQPGDTWRTYADTAAVADALAAMSPTRVFLALGSRDLARFAGLGHAFVARVVDPPETAPPGFEIVVGRPNTSTAAETTLLNEHRVAVVVCRAAGGAAGAAKLAAARALGLPVWLVARPPLPPGIATVAGVAEAMRWLTSAELTPMSSADTADLS